MEIHDFTGQNPDTAGGDYDFLYREHSNQGRWASPDPAGLAAVDPTTPQSWNRYPYVVNNPLTQVDPLGLYYVCDGVFSYDQVDFFTEGLPAGSERTLTGTCISQTLQPWLYSLGGLSTGGGGGGSSGATNNGNTMTSVTQDCLAQYNNSTGGKVTQFFSLYNLATNVKKAWRLTGL